MYGLDQTATIYTPASDTGDFTVLAKSSLACRLAYIEQGGTSIGSEREPIGSRRRLLWEESYTMPETAQVDVGGARWNVLQGTYGELRGPAGEVVYRRCEVISA